MSVLDQLGVMDIFMPQWRASELLRIPDDPRMAKVLIGRLQPINENNGSRMGIIYDELDGPAVVNPCLVIIIFRQGQPDKAYRWYMVDMKGGIWAAHPPSVKAGERWFRGGRVRSSEPGKIDRIRKIIKYWANNL